MLCKKLQSLIQNRMRHERSESVREGRKAVYKSDQPNSSASTPPRWIFKKCSIKSYSHSFRIACDTNAVSLFESSEKRYIYIYIYIKAININYIIVQELCESRGGHPGLSVLTSLLVSVDVKLY